MESTIDGLVALSPAVLGALRLIEQYAPARTPVVLVGETGTGKSYFARVLHQRSGRTGPFEDVTAGELEHELGSDQLFGHTRGAFTGAVGARLGLVAQARDGTLLFDDFQLLRRADQYRLLRLFDRGVYKPVGTDRDAQATCRLVVGLNGDPDELVAAGALMKDLRYRLGHCVIRLPTLAQRPEDIPLLAMRFLEQATMETGVTGGPVRWAPGVLGLLQTAPWPGNLRDLKKAVEAAYLRARAEGAVEIRADHLPETAAVLPRFRRSAGAAANRQAINVALALTQGHVAEAARLCGASRATVYRILAASQASQPSHYTRSVRPEIDPARPEAQAL